ncbi:PI-PLC X domain-containing protein 1 [Contarinia nasturtii]|uniref:PI-PLC X domain-containing protein 1 n=1 Tax=Contarinia nasturtii TaxID=265458 RepID=UPI0012D4B5D9|nr:PI-PLC X domain-containing protein 1 [Contarinia nasturtii]
MFYNSVLLVFGCFSFAYGQFAIEKPFKLSLTISARLNAVEVSWYNLKTPNDGYILLTNEEPHAPFRKQQTDMRQQPHNIHTNEDNSTHKNYASDENIIGWTYSRANKQPLYIIKPDEPNGWITTNITFDNKYLQNLNATTKCYGYWAVYVDHLSNPVFTTCIQAYPTWMNDNKDLIKRFKFRDLFILGSHDSGSYRVNFNTTWNETIVTKYALTQADDITSQLHHGIRYLDIRVGYYRATDPQFWINHGISRQQPFINALHQVRDFVLETNEIVIFDVQEFPVGFGKSLDIHRKLVRYIQKELGELLVDPSGGWEVKLEQIWQNRRNIILAYDHIEMVNEFPSFIFQSVQQRWGNCQNLADLKRFLAPSGHSFTLFSSRPFADMAELTPTTWDVLIDKWGGLRRVADTSNRLISKWYAEEWFMSANIVAVDFYRGTNLMETAIYSNLKKDLLRRLKK